MVLTYSDLTLAAVRADAMILTEAIVDRAPSVVLSPPILKVPEPPPVGSLKPLEADLGVHPTQLRNWVKQLADDPQHAFPGLGQMKPEQLEIAQLKREVARLKAERDILKKAAAYFAKEST
jgi:hypothetical protein